MLGLCILLSLVLSWSGAIMVSAATPQYLGDVDGGGLLDAADALLVLQHSVNIISLTQTQREAANVTCDDQIDATDALYILQRSVGLRNLFPMGAPWGDNLPSNPNPLEPYIPMPFQPDDPVPSKPEPPISSEPDDSPKVVEINESSFPDAVFRDDVMAFDLNHDGWLSENEIAKVTEMNVTRYDAGIPEIKLPSREIIVSLKGIEYFTELKSLQCDNNNIVTLDVSNNIKLETLICSRNQLAGLDVQSNSELERLDCSANQLTELDCSHNLKLRALTCKWNLISTLDLTNNSALTYVLHDKNVNVVGWPQWASL